jgi:hypothetical protein
VPADEEPPLAGEGVSVLLQAAKKDKTATLPAATEIENRNFMTGTKR